MDQGSLLWQKGGETNTQTLQTSALLPNYYVDFANEFLLSLFLWIVPSVESKASIFVIQFYSSFLLSWYTETLTQAPTSHSHQWHTQVQTHHRLAVKEQPKLTKMHRPLECCQVDLFEKLSVRSHFLVSVGEAKPLQQIRNTQQNSEPVRARQACN